MNQICKASGCGGWQQFRFLPEEMAFECLNCGGKVLIPSEEELVKEFEFIPRDLPRFPLNKLRDCLKFRGASTMSGDMGMLLYGLAKKYAVKKAIDCGTGHGHSAMCLKKARVTQVITIDVTKWFSDEEEPYISSSDWQQIEKRPGNTLKILPTLKGYDFVFLDDNHTYKHVKKELEIIIPEIKKNDGLIVFDDYGLSGGPTGVKEAVLEVKHKFRTFQAFSFPHGPKPRGLGYNGESMAMLTDKER